MRLRASAALVFYKEKDLTREGAFVREKILSDGKGNLLQYLTILA